MQTIEGPADLAHIAEVLDTVNALLPKIEDDNLAHRAAALQGYLALSRAFPDKDYHQILAKTLSDLEVALQKHRVKQDI
jgi:hypothetical protein